MTEPINIVTCEHCTGRKETEIHTANAITGEDVTTSVFECTYRTDNHGNYPTVDTTALRLCELRLKGKGS
jgi:hypothetical protein